MMQDFTPGEKRSVRNISIDRPQTLSGNGGAPSAPNEGPQMPPPSSPREPGMPPFPRAFGRKERSKWARLSIWGGAALVCVIILIVIIGSFFEGATVTIVPRHALVSLENTLTVGSTGDSAVIPYDEVSISLEDTREVPATGEERVEQAASGRIVVYNDYDAESLRLIKNTRFETPEGLIYRIRDSIVIPGQKKDANGNTVPGSIEIEVFADSPGETYNIGLTDFTVPGLKEGNDPHFEKVYGRSKTPMEGGFVGTVKTASNDDTTTARTELKDALTAKSQGALEASLPDGYMVLPETLTTSFEDLPNADGAETGTVSIRMKATVRGIAIDSHILAESAAKIRIPDYGGEPIRFLDTRGLTLSAENPLSISELPDTFPVTISGSGTLVWVIVADTLRESLIGIPRSDAQDVFARNPAIQNADLRISPVWRRSLPDDPETIKIVEDTNAFAE